MLPRLRPKKGQKKRWEALELDEMGTFVGRKKRQVWLWLAVERVSRRIVAWVLGRRDAATARRLWQALPKRYRRHCWYFTDLWESYVGVLRGRLAPLAPPALPQRKRWHQHRRSHQLFPTPTLRRTGPQILLVQQVPTDARNAH